VGLLTGLLLLVTPIGAFDGVHALGVTLLISGFIGVALLFAAAETAVAAMRRPRLQQLLDEGSPAARTLQRLLERSAAFVTASQLIITAVLVATNTLLVATLGEPLAALTGSGASALALIALFVLALHFVVVQQAGRGLGLRYCEPIALTFAGPARASVLALTPLVWLMNRLGGRLHGDPAAGARESAGTVTEAGIKLQVDVAEEEGVLEQDEGEMIRSIFEFGDTVAREIMIPRIDVEGAEEEQTLAEVVDLVVRAGHSRIPIYQDTIDRITGIFYVKDSLRFLREGRLDVKVREVMRTAYFVPETKKVDELLHEMQSRRVHLAVVVDEYGGTAGLVTIEDILEEIVGEIQDEYDVEEAQIEHVSESEVVVDALMTLDDVNDHLSINLQAEDVDTLGGYVYAKLGRVPEQGDQITSDGARLIVEEIEGNRINRVRIVKRSEDEIAADHEVARRQTEEG
jgi:CBS domain containing-hemolysin-like protein